MKLRIISSWLIFFFVLALHACAVGQAKHEAEKQDTVCITRTGKKYHVCSCRYLSQSSISITLKNALARGYGACSVCDPPTGEVDSQETSTQADESESRAKSKPDPVAASKQCMAYTKSGLRCKRTTGSSTGKCWQHEK